MDQPPRPVSRVTGQCPRRRLRAPLSALCRDQQYASKTLRPVSTRMPGQSAPGLVPAGRSALLPRPGPWSSPEMPCRAGFCDDRRPDQRTAGSEDGAVQMTSDGRSCRCRCRTAARLSSAVIHGGRRRPGVVDHNFLQGPYQPAAANGGYRPRTTGSRRSAEINSASRQRSSTSSQYRPPKVAGGSP